MSLGAGIEFLGPWDETKRSLVELPRHLRNASKYATKEVAEEYYARLVGHIYNQDLPWFPLGEKYLKRKQSQFGNTEIYIRSSKLLDSIKVYSEGMTSSVGIKAGINHPFSKLKVYEIALQMEHGYKKIPARPLWMPTFKKMGGPVGVSLLIAKEMRKYLRDRGYPTKW